MAPMPIDAVATAAATATIDQGTASPDDPKKLTQEERRARICLFLSTRITKHGHPQNGALEEAAKRFGYAKGSVQGVWTRHRDAILHPDKYTLDVRRKSGSGRTCKYTADEVRAAVGRVPRRFRTSARSIALHAGIPHQTLRRHLKKEDIVNIAAKGGTNNETEETRRGEKEERGEQTAAADAVAARNERQLRKLREEKKELSRRTQFPSEKERAIHRLRVEINRHQLEFAKLEGELDRIQTKEWGGMEEE